MGVEYFTNHDRRTVFPWSLYHASIDGIVAGHINRISSPRILVVGCGLDPGSRGVRDDATFFGCDLDTSAIEECGQRDPGARARLAVCPSPMELPREGAFAEPFDVVLAKEVIEHTEDPAAWARVLFDRVRPEGLLILTTPNYGSFSTLPWLERTVLEVVAWRDGYSRKDIHPSRFSRASLRRLSLGPAALPPEVSYSFLQWALVGCWRRSGPPVAAAAGSVETNDA